MDISSTAAGLLGGAEELSREAIKYPALWANYVMGATGIRGEREAERKAQLIKDATASNPFISERYNGFLQYARESNPKAAIAGGALASGGVASLFRKGIKSANGAKYKSMFGPVSAAALFGGAAAAGAAKEVYVEPEVDDIIYNIPGMD